MKLLLFTMAVLGLLNSAIAAEQAQIIECPIYAELPFPLSNESGRIVSHVVKDGDTLKSSSLFDVPGTYGIEEHLLFQGGKLQEFYQYSRYGNPTHKWTKMTLDRSRGGPVADVTVIRGDDEGDFDKEGTSSQKPFFKKHSKAGTFDPVRNQPLSAAWIADFDAAKPTNRNGDMRPNPFTDDLENPFHAIFYAIRMMKAADVQAGSLNKKLFVVGKRKQIYPVTFVASSTRTAGVYSWKTAIVLQEKDQPMSILVDHNTHTVKSFKLDVTVKVPVLGSATATLKSTGPCVSR